MPNHVPVLLAEALEWLDIQPNKWYVDGTFGRGGHTQAILAKNAKVIAFDVDHEAIEFGKTEFAKEIASGQLILLRRNFDQLYAALQTLEAREIAGILFDFGTTSDQLKDTDRGFSFEGNAPLDMRMDDRLGVTAHDLLAILPEKQLMTLFIEYGGEHEAKRIAEAIVERRQYQPVKTTQELADLIIRAKRERRGHLHPATKVFQALRIAVNSELDAISLVLPQAIQAVAKNGRIVTISFHEGEDRMVKQAFREWQDQGKGKVLTKNVILAGDKELQTNPRARSAKLRAFEKTL